MNNSYKKIFFFLFIFGSFTPFVFGQSSMYFKTLDQKTTGIDFANKLTERDTFNYLNFQYMYNGGGVAVGDINNDGLQDIYFTGNQVADKLYLNKGNLQFEDITKKALDDNVDKGWHTGVTMADVNQDGWLDIYVCRSGLSSFKDLRSNLLYINNHDNTFTEKSAEYGVDISKGTNHAAFFDMDKDGDLDLYVLNRPYEEDYDENETQENYASSDDLLEYVDGKFINISEKAGIQNRGFGLGVAISDINQDGWLDIYVSNDYVMPDYCYINQGNKTFKDELKERTNHVSQFGMGCDIADFNNDGFVDIMVVDMAANDHIKSKKTMAGMNPNQFWESVIDHGRQYEYMYNTLQLNNGNGTFSEIAQISGVQKSDWSWGPLFVDFDNDGLKDLLITNGYRREVRDNDYVIKLRGIDYDISDFEEVLAMADETKVENYFYKNEGDLKFKLNTEEWQTGNLINSNGAAYADLDLDGDVDIVVNNMEDVSTIIENKLDNGNNFFRIDLGDHAEGAKIWINAGGKTYYQEGYGSRGYLSKSETVIHFGIGKAEKIDLIKVDFADGKKYLNMTSQNANQQVKVPYENNYLDEGTFPLPTIFRESNIINYKHTEYVMNDFAREILIPHRMSQLGPFMSKGDINGDKLDDFYISGSRYYPGAMFLQLTKGKFTKISGPWENDKEKEELGSLFFDCDNDGDQDLYVIGGSNEYLFYTGDPKEIEYNKNLQDRLYINNGQGQFTDETANRLPEMILSGQRVTAGDYDKDGDLDLFIGGRQIPGYYPFAPQSYLLRNDDGKFTDVTSNSPDLKNPGMITESVWQDFDNDGDLDLICVGEWMPVTFFRNDNNSFKNVTAELGLDKSVGWWMSISSGDFNGDGIADYVVGNIGENNKFHPSIEKPLEVFVKDFDNNGTNDIVLGKYTYGDCYPVRGRQCSSQQMPFILDKFPTYDQFAHANLETIYGNQNLDSALHYSATEFANCVILSNGEGGFELHHLPIEAQLGPINASLVDDFNGDGILDILGVGNNFAAEIETVRYDGGRGALLLGDGNGHFKTLAPNESGFFVNTDAKDMILIDNYVIVSSNSDSIKVFNWLLNE
ncbi:VCBS repeat-containing protein [Paracrocinitomix mangrovi]|uniref:VCBS repeat-containing protein n=1 Tax=Paracrocinitomix mangrovi TaxID=2862509 RepID=UPI001C8DDC45|nr:VCBS repeat-containing protein [Paracrocinitomix mangrovi]UKN02861.1 VCBS repeat-containing protein [Paracrocinitomix mangrovi]